MSINQPAVTVILTSYNHEKYIREAIESVLNQTFVDFELIIWDDASSDDSWQIIKTYADPRIRAFRNEKNKGPCFGVNNSIFDLSRGQYIAIHHSDDIWQPTKLEKQVDYLDKHPGLGALFSQANIIDEDGGPLAGKDHFYSSIFRQNNRSRFEWLRHFLLRGNCLCHPSVLIPRSTYLRVGPYDKRLAQIPDFDMWTRICLHYEIHILVEPLIKFRVRSGEANQSGCRPETIVRMANEQMLVLRNFAQVACVQDLYAIIPEIRERFPTGAPISYQLAMYAVETDNDVLQAFGLELLYELMADDKSSKMLENLGFTTMDLIALSGRCDFFRRGDMLREIERVKQSVSWKITKPLRLFWNLLS